jgi:hypothetical protein
MDEARLETEVARERSRAEQLVAALILARSEAAIVPALKSTIEAMRTAVAKSEEVAAQLRSERDQLLTAQHLHESRRWWRRLVG